ncbi:MAG: hypothetical protein HY549_01205 [Elusimicrobia bacterium]|nr:hypothetical protein [Elusimicrobiota bacterium]
MRGVLLVELAVSAFAPAASGSPASQAAELANRGDYPAAVDRYRDALKEQPARAPTGI